MLDKMRQALIALTAMGQQRSNREDVRKLQGIAAKVFSTPESARKGLDALAAIEAAMEAETASWVDPDILAAGRGGAFDACDLRHWMSLAERAGIECVPAREILVLTESEMAAASGKIDLADTALKRGVYRRAEKVLAALELPQPPDEAAEVVDMEALQERLHAALDDVPEGWMVRSNRAGGEELKALAGAGVALDTAPEVRFGADLEVGPGWIRNGNRRRINASDNRTVTMAAQGPGGAVFLARPWMKAARYLVGDDPHRHGTVFAGKGAWPCEWRAFIENGKVTGVAFYYAWTGQATPENAAIALEVAEKAQAVANEAVRQGAYPRFLDIELLRAGPQGRDPIVAIHLTRFDRESVSGTLDFLETEQGLLLLEGGPPNTPFGGGHPCAFAGSGGPPRFPNRTEIDGVAFCLMPGVVLASPATWIETDRNGCILSWDEVRELAAAPAPRMG